MQTIQHWIDGSYVNPEPDSRLGEVTNPATGKVSSRVALASTAVVHQRCRQRRQHFRPGGTLRWHGACRSSSPSASC